jgi:high-affinity iron transporter
VVLTGKGIHSFQVLNYIPVHALAIPRVELLGIFPTIETCATQVLVLMVVVLVWNITAGGKKN